MPVGEGVRRWLAGSERFLRGAAARRLTLWFVSVSSSLSGGGVRLGLLLLLLDLLLLLLLLLLLDGDLLLRIVNLLFLFLDVFAELGPGPVP